MIFSKPAVLFVLAFLFSANSSFANIKEQYGEHVALKGQATYVLSSMLKACDPSFDPENAENEMISKVERVCGKLPSALLTPCMDGIYSSSLTKLQTRINLCATAWSTFPGKALEHYREKSAQE